MMNYKSGLLLLALPFVSACASLREPQSTESAIVISVPRRQPASQYRDLISCKVKKITNEKLSNDLYRDTFSVEGYPVVSVSALSDGLNPDYAMLVGANPSYEKGVDGVTAISNYSEKTVVDFRISFKDGQVLRLLSKDKKGQLRFGTPNEVLTNETNASFFAELSCTVPQVRSGY